MSRMYARPTGDDGFRADCDALGERPSPCRDVGGVVRIAARDVVVDIDLNREQGRRRTVLNDEPDCFHHHAAKVQIQNAVEYLVTHDRRIQRTLIVPIDVPET